MTTFDEQVETGVRAMFAQARTGAYADLEFDEIPEEHRESWRHNFAIGYRAALRHVAAQHPQYRVSHVPRNSDGEAGIWYRDGTFGDLDTASRSLRLFRDAGYRAMLEQRWCTEWTEVEL